MTTIDELAQAYGEREEEPGGLHNMVNLVRFDDGRQWEVEVDQRDIYNGLQAIKQTDPRADPLGTAFASSWACLRRLGEIALPWPEFLKVCSHAHTLRAVRVDPTPTATAD
jgi:hypothetical protein